MTCVDSRHLHHHADPWAQHINNLLKPMHVMTSEAQDEENDAAGSVRWAIRLSLIANFALAGLQVS